MKYLYKNAGYESVNRVNYYRSLVKKAGDAPVKNWSSTATGGLIGALLGGGLGLMLSPDDISALLTAGVLGGIGGGIGVGVGNYYGNKE